MIIKATEQHKFLLELIVFLLIFIPFLLFATLLFFLLLHNFQWLHPQGLTLTPEERINRTIRVIINFLRFSASVEWRFLSFAIDWQFSLPLCCCRLQRPSSCWCEQEKKNFIFNLLSSLDSDSARDFIITSANISYRLSLIVVRYSLHALTMRCLLAPTFMLGNDFNDFIMKRKSGSKVFYTLAISS